VVFLRSRLTELIIHADEANWVSLVVLVSITGFAIRAAVALGGFGTSTDLAIYTYFSRFVARGINPYHVQPLASAGGATADEPILEFVLYAGLFRLWDSPIVLRLFFAACDAATIALFGLLMQRTRGWRLGAMLFLAFCPLVLTAWVLLPEDKSLVVLLITLVLAQAERGRVAAAWAATAALAAIKWVGAFFALPLFVEGYRAVGRRVIVVAVAAAVVFALGTLPFFPDGLLAVERRSGRMNSPPSFDSITILLDRVHLYDPLLVRLWIPAALLTIAVLHMCRKIDIGEAIALSCAAPFVFLPDEPPDRILLVTVVLMLIVRPRWLLWWTVSLVPTVWCLIDYVFAIHHPLRRLTGPPGEWRHVIGANLLLIVVTACYLADKISDRGREPVIVHSWPESVPRIPPSVRPS